MATSEQAQLVDRLQAAIGAKTMIVGATSRLNRAASRHHHCFTCAHNQFAMHTESGAQALYRTHLTLCRRSCCSFRWPLLSLACSGSPGKLNLAYLANSFCSPIRRYCGANWTPPLNGRPTAKLEPVGLLCCCCCCCCWKSWKKGREQSGEKCERQRQCSDNARHVYLI